MALTPFPETSGGGGARAGRRLGPDSWRIAERSPPGLEQPHHADLCLGCKPHGPPRAQESSRHLRESHLGLPRARPSLDLGSDQLRLRGAERARSRAGSVRRFAQAARGGAARVMAGDSEQTLQNHQQPNGGEPFLIGVSGGTASGKVRVRAPCPHGGRRMWPAPAGRVSCSLPPRGPRDPRSGPPRSGAARPRAGSGRGVRDQWGDPGDRGSRVRVPLTSSPAPAGMVRSLAGSRRRRL